MHWANACVCDTDIENGVTFEILQSPFGDKTARRACHQQGYRVVQSDRFYWVSLRCKLSGQYNTASSYVKICAKFTQDCLKVPCQNCRVALYTGEARPSFYRLNLSICGLCVDRSKKPTLRASNQPSRQRQRVIACLQSAHFSGPPFWFEICFSNVNEYLTFLVTATY